MELSIPESLSDFYTTGAVGKWRAKRAFKPQARLDFYRLLASYHEDKATTLDAVEEMAITHAQRRHPLAYMYRQWERSLRNGMSLTNAMEGWAPATERGFVRVGEDTEMIRPLAELTESLEARIKNAQRWIAAALVPAGRIAVVIATFFGIAMGIAPRIAATVPMDNVAPYVLTFFAVCEFIAKYGWIIIALIVMIFVGAFAAMPVLTGPAREKLDRIWPFTWYQRLQSGLFLITLAAMMRSKIPIIEALQNNVSFATPWMKSFLKMMIRRVREGAGDGEAVGVGLLPREVADEVARYSARSGVERAMQRIGQKTLDELNRSMDRLVLISGPITMFGLFILIVTFLAALKGVIDPLMAAAQRAQG